MVNDSDDSEDTLFFRVRHKRKSKNVEVKEKGKMNYIESMY